MIVSRAIQMIHVSYFISPLLVIVPVRVFPYLPSGDVIGSGYWWPTLSLGKIKKILRLSGNIFLTLAIDIENNKLKKLSFQ